MKKYLSVFVFVLLMAAVPAFGEGSYFYAFSSGDVLDLDAAPTYGMGRIDFSGGVPTPTVLTSGDTKAITVGAFPYNGKTYLYSSKTDKKDTSTTTMTTTYAFYDPDKGLNNEIKNATERVLVVNISNDMSIDIALPPDDQTGTIYVIDNNETLIAYDPIAWTRKSAALPEGYDQYKLVSLAPDSWNYLYVWSSKRKDVQADGSYTAISSDIHVYDRDTLEKLATFSNVRTGFDTTKQKADDETSLEMGRGLVYIEDKFIAYVAYDSADVNSAHIVKIDENTLTSLVIVTSADIGERNIDIESPMPDLKGGIYFEAYSRDANPNEPATRGSYIYHWTSSSLVSLDVENGKSNGELVIADGKYKGDIMVYVLTDNTTNGQVYTYLWDGSTSSVTYQIDNGSIVGVEIEKPFSDGADGLYFMAERKIETTESSQEAYEADAFWWWSAPGAEVKEVFESTSELEIEAPELDANNGFYFVNASADINETEQTGTTNMTLHYCKEGEVTFVADLGTFDVPPSTFKTNTADPYATPKEKLQDEFILLSDDEYDLLFAGAGPVGGNFKLTVFNYSNKDTKPLSEDDIIEPVFTDEDMGGYADLAGSQKFTDGTPSPSSYAIKAVDVDALQASDPTTFSKIQSLASNATIYGVSEENIKSATSATDKVRNALDDGFAISSSVATLTTTAGYYLVSLDVPLTVTAENFKVYLIKTTSSLFSTSQYSGIAAKHDDVITARILDAGGNEVTGSTTVPSTVYVLANLPSTGDYGVYTATKSSSAHIGSSGGGCDAGLGFSAVGLALLFALKSKRQ